MAAAFAALIAGTLNMFITLLGLHLVAKVAMKW